MGLKWEVRKNSADAHIGRFWFSVTSGRKYQDGTYQYMIYQGYRGGQSSKEIITLGRCRGCLDEAIAYADTLVEEIIPVSKEYGSDAKTLQLRLSSGYLVATISDDPDYPGIDVEYLDDKDNGTNSSRPRVLIEAPVDDRGAIRALVWNNSDSEDYTEDVKLYNPN